MPASASQSSARLTTPAAGNPLPAPSDLAVLALAVGDVASGNLNYSGIAGLSFRIVNAHAVKVAAAGAVGPNNDQLQTAAGVAITDAIDMLVADTTLVRATSIDPATHVIAAGGGLRIAHVKGGGNSACIFYVYIALV